MKRIHLFEWEDFGWVPTSIRTGATNLIIVFSKILGVPAVVSQLIKQAQQKTSFQQIVDLGSGSGGPMLQVVPRLNQESQESPISLLLTDLHPNPELVERINKSEIPDVQYSPSPTNAAQMDETPQGLKTMMNSFHHLPPKVAQQVLLSAQENRQPILIYEMTENKMPTLLWWLLLPISLIMVFIMALLLTPFVRPLTPKQLLFTYIIPVIPLLYTWDGQVSYIRMYTYADIRSLIGPATPKYAWEMGPAINAKGKALGYYVMGYPS